MSKPKVKSYTKVIKDLMGEKTHILSKAHVLSEMGMLETAQPLWMSAAVYEESIAPLLDGLGRELEAAVHRVSAASCYQNAGDLIRAVNLYRAALAGPLRDDTRQEVDKMLTDCLSQLTQQSTKLTPPPHVQTPSVVV